MFDVIGDPLRYRFRLIGAEINAILGKDSTGQWMDEAFPDVIKTGILENYDHVATLASPLYRKGSPQYYVPEHRVNERLLLPIAGEDRACSILLGISVYS